MLIYSHFNLVQKRNFNLVKKMVSGIIIRNELRKRAKELGIYHSRYASNNEIQYLINQKLKQLEAERQLAEERQRELNRTLYEKIEYNVNYTDKYPIFETVHNNNIGRPIENDFFTVKKSASRLIFAIKNPQLKKSNLIEYFNHIGQNLGRNYRYAMLFGNDWDTPTRVAKEATAKNIKDFIYMQRIYEGDVFIIQVYHINNNPQDFILADSDIQCVINAIIEKYPNEKEFLAPLIDTMIAKKLLKPFSEGKYSIQKEGVLFLARKIKTTIRIRHQMGIWYDTSVDYKGGRRVMDIFAHNNHAVLYKAPNFNIEDIVYCDNYMELENKFYNESPYTPTKARINFDNYIDAGNERSSINIMSFVRDGKMHKVWKPKYDVSDIMIEDNFEIIDATNININTQDNTKKIDIKYAYCTNDLSYDFTTFKEQNNLRELKNEYYSIAKHATNYLTNQQFMPFINNQQYHSYDINRAYPSFTLNPEYKNYLLPVGNCNVFSISNDVNEQTEVLNLISTHSGWCEITNVVYLNKTVDKIKWIQSNNWYTNMRLNNIIKNQYATFTITKFCIAEKAEIKFPFKDLTSTEKSDKQYNNQFIGRLTAGGKDAIRSESYLTKDPLELLQLEYYCNTNSIDYITHDYSHYNGNECVKYMFVLETRTPIPDSKNKALFHLTSYIIDYCQLTLVNAMVNAEKQHPNCIIGYNTDGFYTNQKIDLPNISTTPHDFKYSKQIIKSNFKYENDEHSPYELKYAPKYQTYKDRLYNKVLTYGPAGCYKSNDFITEPLVGQIMGLPTHLLKASTRKRTNAFPSDTYHKVFGIGGSNVQLLMNYSNIVVDETTMISENYLKDMIYLAEKYKLNLYIIGDIDPEFGNMQLEGQGIPITNDLIHENNFIWFKPDMLRRRQPLDQAAKLDSLRGHCDEYQKTLLKEFIPKEKFITIEQAEELFYEEYSNDRNIIAISSSNRKCNAFNKSIKDRNPKKIKAKCLETIPLNNFTKGEIVDIKFENNDFVYWDVVKSKDYTDIPKKFKYIASYMCTCDAAQGATIDYKIIVDLRPRTIHNDDELEYRKNYIYTAVSRCTDLSQLYFII